MPGVLQTAAVLLHCWSQPHKSVTPQKSYSASSWPCWMEEAPPIVQRVALLMCSITSVGLHALKCALFCSLQIGRHSTGDHNIRQKYGWIYGALWTCPKGTVFAAVLVRIITCNILKVHTGHVRTFPLNTSSDQGRHPLVFSQRAPGTGATPVFVAPPHLRFTDQLQTGRLQKEGMQDGATAHLWWKGSITCVW